MTEEVALSARPVPPTIRSLTDADLPYVMSTWLRSHQRSRAWLRDLPIKADIYYAGQRRVCERLLGEHGGLIACDPLEPMSIWGWICATAHAVHYVYVRPPMRERGVATDLLSKFVADDRRFVFSHFPPRNMVDVPRDPMDGKCDRACAGPTHESLCRHWRSLEALGPLPRAQFDWLGRWMLERDLTYDPYSVMR